MSILDDLIKSIDEPEVKDPEPEKEETGSMFPHSKQFEEYAKNNTVVDSEEGK